jgi:cell division septum initiation protein DivIVA
MADQIIDKIDTMGKRVDDLEKSMTDLMAQVEGTSGGASTSGPSTTSQNSTTK